MELGPQSGCGIGWRLRPRGGRQHWAPAGRGPSVSASSYPHEARDPGVCHMILNSLQPVTIFIRAPSSQPLQLFLLVLGSPARVQVLQGAPWGHPGWRQMGNPHPAPKSH